MNLGKESARLLKEFAPKGLREICRSVTGKGHFVGDFSSWEEASSHSGTAGVGSFLESAAASTLKVKTGDALFVRDSVVFQEQSFWWPLSASLLWVASRNGNRLNLLDFGGSLGSTYYQNRQLLNHLPLQWSIVELPEFVERGRREFENEHIRFYYDIEEAVQERAPDAALVSGVIQYIEKPYEVLAELKRQKFKQLVFDRVPCLIHDLPGRIMLQRIKQDRVLLSPIRFFNEREFLDFLSDEYRLVADFDSFDHYSVLDVAAKARGFIFERKGH